MLDIKNDEKSNGVQEIDDKLRKLFIGGLSEKTTEETSKEYFSQYGEVQDINILRYEDGRSRKFAFITYATDDGARKCLEDKKVKGHKLDDKNIEVKRAMPRGKQDRNSALKTHKIFVGGLDITVDEETIKSYFEENFRAKITKVDFIKEKKQEGKEQKRRRFCFLTLDDTDLVDELVIRHFHEVAGGKVEVKKAEPKGSRQRYHNGYYDYGYGTYPDNGYYYANSGHQDYYGHYGYHYPPHCGYGYGGYHDNYPPYNGYYGNRGGPNRGTGPHTNPGNNTPNTNNHHHSNGGGGRRGNNTNSNRNSAPHPPPQNGHHHHPAATSRKPPNY